MSVRTVAVVDYGMGNLRSVSQAVMHVRRGHGASTVIVTATPTRCCAAERVVLPGQGAMRDCMRELRDSGLKDAVLHAAAHKPLMGVCVGMQMLLDHSEEQDTPGPGPDPRRGAPLPAGRPAAARRQPLQGAADGLEPRAPGSRTRCGQGVPDGSWFYFVHSYYAEPADPRTAPARPTTARALPAPGAG
jgi:glutamine amidotransferase